MGIAGAVEVVAIMLAPTLLVLAALHVVPACRAIRRFVWRRHHEEPLQPTHPPIEQLAADLRRLLWRHESIRRTLDIPMRAQRLRAVEAAIADCATETAGALDVPAPDRPTGHCLPTPQLRRLLHALAAEGLVLPPEIGLLAASDSRDDS